MNILITGVWQEGKNYIAEIKKLGHSVKFLQYEKDDLPCDYEWVDALICNGIFLHHKIEKFINLKYIQLTSAGFDRVPMDYVKEHNIKINNARGVYSIPMAEYAITGVLSLYKSMNFFYENQKKNLWEKNRNLLELNGKTVTILGCGNVGSECAKRFKAFGCKVLGLDVILNDNPFFTFTESEWVNVVEELNANVSGSHQDFPPTASGVELRQKSNAFLEKQQQLAVFSKSPNINVRVTVDNQSLPLKIDYQEIKGGEFCDSKTHQSKSSIYHISQINKILPISDIVVLTMPLTEETYHLFNEEKFKLLKSNCILINISRGAVIDTNALENNIDKIGGAVLDVFEEEPLNETSPIWQKENVIITPHNSFVSNGNNERLNKVILKNLQEING